MNLRICSYVFAPSWAATLITLALLPGLVSLGWWQLQRAEQKRALMVQAQQGKQQLVNIQSEGFERLPRYQHVSVKGYYDDTRQIFLDNMPSTDPSRPGQPGYRVLTPFVVDDQGNTALVLVDRGWVRGATDRKQLPIVNVGSQLREIRGLIDNLPQPGVRAGDAGIKNGVWPQVLNYPKVQELRAIYGDLLFARIILLDPDQAEGYSRFWSIDLGFTPERHVGYAVQWFGLALTLLIIYIVVNLKRIDVVK